MGSRSLELDEVYHQGIAGVFDIVNRPMTLDAAMADTRSLVLSASRNLIALFGTLTK